MTAFGIQIETRMTGDEAMTWTVEQTFESLGDPCSSEHASREEAETAADELQTAIADMVAGWERDDDDDAVIRDCYVATEADAWETAAALAGDAPTYGLAAGAYMAAQAGGIEENGDGG